MFSSNIRLAGNYNIYFGYQISRSYTEYAIKTHTNERKKEKLQKKYKNNDTIK